MLVLMLQSFWHDRYTHLIVHQRRTYCFDDVISSNFGSQRNSILTQARSMLLFFLICFVCVTMRKSFAQFSEVPTHSCNPFGALGVILKILLTRFLFTIYTLQRLILSFVRVNVPSYFQLKLFKTFFYCKFSFTLQRTQDWELLHI